MTVCIFNWQYGSEIKNYGYIIKADKTNIKTGRTTTIVNVGKVIISKGAARDVYQKLMN